MICVEGVLDPLAAAPGGPRGLMRRARPADPAVTSWPSLPEGWWNRWSSMPARAFPVALFNRDAGQPLNATYYHTSRVSLADLAAGRF